MNDLFKALKTVGLIFLFSLGVQAQTEIDYNETLINQQVVSLKNIESQSTDNATTSQVEANLQKLKQIQDFAKGCIAAKQEILNNTQSLQSYSTSILLKETQDYNQDMLSKINQHKASCILLANQTNSDINTLLTRLNKLDTANKNPNILQIISDPSFKALPLNFVSLNSFFSLNNLTETEIIFSLLIFLVTLGISCLISLRCHKLAKKITKKTRKYITYQLSIYLPILFPLISTFIYLYILKGQQANLPILLEGLLLIIGLILLRFSFRFYLDIVHVRINKIWKTNILKAFSWVFYGILLTYFIRQSLIHLLQQNLLVIFITEIWLIFTNLFFIYAWMNLLNAIIDPRFFTKIKYKKIYVIKILFTIFIMAVFLFRGILALNGFPEYVLNFNLKIILSGLVFISLLNWNNLLKHFEANLQNNKTTLGDKIHHILGLKSSAKIQELTLIRFCVLVLSYVVLINWLLQFLDININIQLIYNSFIYTGFYLGNIKIIPVHIIYALIVFALVLLIGEGVTNTITSQPIFIQNADRRHSITKLMNYFFYVLASISSVMVLGFSFQQICILLGALTIGFGVALQSVILDFISGLILIITKLVHIEDYISIKFVSTLVTTNGYVQKINLLNTQLVSDQGTIINVPNSQLLKNILANNTLSNKTKKCYLTFNIRKINDVDKAQRIIQSVVSPNKSIIQKSHQRPIVCYEKQGFLHNKNVYIVSLKIYLRSLSKKITVTEHLKETIYKELEQNNIEYLKQEED